MFPVIWCFGDVINDDLDSYRPVPMDQEYLGLNERKAVKRIELMNDLVYEKVMEYAGKHQVLIFVHNRKETVNTAKAIKEKCLNKDTLGLFLRDKKASTLVLQQDLDKVKRIFRTRLPSNDCW